jgi:hypothetical protein
MRFNEAIQSGTAINCSGQVPIRIMGVSGNFTMWVWGGSDFFQILHTLPQLDTLTEVETLQRTCNLDLDAWSEG